VTSGFFVIGITLQKLQHDPGGFSPNVGGIVVWSHVLCQQKNQKITLISINCVLESTQSGVAGEHGFACGK
jgi:hypothetical protein